MRPLITAALAAAVLIACAKDESSAPEGDSPAAGERSPAAEPPAKSAKGKSDKDKGSATLTIGDQSWSADRCTARIRDGRLRISASRMEMNGGKARRQSLSLDLADFSGPADYQAGGTSSFVGVGLDVEAAKAAGDDDAKTAGVAADSISKADFVRLAGAKVTITSADDDVVAGRFEWTPPEWQKDKTPIRGELRAVIDK